MREDTEGERRTNRYWLAATDKKTEKDRQTDRKTEAETQRLAPITEQTDQKPTASLISVYVCMREDTERAKDKQVLAGSKRQEDRERQTVRSKDGGRDTETGTNN